MAVAIVGAGLAGLSCARALRRVGRRVRSARSAPAPPSLYFPNIIPIKLPYLYSKYHYIGNSFRQGGDGWWAHRGGRGRSSRLAVALRRPRRSRTLPLSQHCQRGSSLISILIVLYFS